MIGNEQTTTFYHKPTVVEAVRLTLDNMERIADYLGADYSEVPDGESKANISYAMGIGWDGDWLLSHGDEQFEFIGHEDFLEKYQVRTLDSVLNENRKILFNGPPNEVVNWLRSHNAHLVPDLHVYRGSDLAKLSVDAYLAYRAEQVSERQAQIESIVLQAVSAQAKATYHSDDDGGMTILAQQAAEKIVRLFT